LPLFWWSSSNSVSSPGSATATWTLQRSAALQTGLGSVPVCLLGMFIGNAKAGVRDFGFWRRVLVHLNADCGWDQMINLRNYVLAV
jgi:hypothetical protein